MSTEHVDPVIDSGDFRSVLGRFPTGVTVVTAAGSDGPVGVAIGSFASISLDPPLVGFFLGTQSSSAEAIRQAGHFCVNVLCDDQMELCGVMASRAADKFADVAWTPAGTGAPILPDVHAVIDCHLERMEELGDHYLMVGRVQSLQALRDQPPMIFYTGQYGTFAS
jgi:flavin reductase (DIM6/NTAB) family NADH-FMN oxidoreductase RutF